MQYKDKISVSDPVCFRPDPDPCFEKNRIRIPDLGSGSWIRIFKFCESISLEYAVVICRFIGKRACRTWFYSVKNILSTWGWFSTHPIMSFNKKYENFKLILLRIFVGIRIRDPDPGSGCSDRIRIPTCQNTRIRPDPDPKHCHLSFFYNFWGKSHISENFI